jgi:hypothetical protein
MSILLNVSRLLTLGFALAWALNPGYAVGSALTVKIIAFNDFHGNLESGSMLTRAGQSPESVGGGDYLAAYVAQLVSQNPNHVVVAAGDLVGASPLISAFYHDEATIEVMNALGLEFSAVGNHEFDAALWNCCVNNMAVAIPRASNRVSCSTRFPVRHSSIYRRMSLTLRRAKPCCRDTGSRHFAVFV